MKAQMGLVLAVVVLMAIIGVGVLFFFSGTNPEEDSGTSSGMLIEGINNAGNMIVEDSNKGMQETTPETHYVDIEDFSYEERTLSIKKGDTVVWTNKDNVGHTVTSDSGSELSSSLLSRGKSYSHTFTETGTFDYHCKPHPYMKGTIVVR